MPKRNHAVGNNDAPDAFKPATKTAINKHGWTEVQFAHEMGRLRFMEGIGPKIAAEITMHLQESSGENNLWQRLIDLVQPHLNNCRIKHMDTLRGGDIVDEPCLRQVREICALPQYATGALLGAYLSKMTKYVRESAEADSDLPRPIFEISQARANPYQYLCKRWKLSLHTTDRVAIEKYWWDERSPIRLRAYLEDGLKYLINTNGHTICGYAQLMQRCMRQLNDNSREALSNTLSQLIKEDDIFIGLRSSQSEDTPKLTDPPQAIAYTEIYEQECAIARAVAQLTTEYPCYTFDTARDEAARSVVNDNLESASGNLPDDAQWNAIRGLYNSTLGVLQGPAGCGKTEVVLRGLAELLLSEEDWEYADSDVDADSLPGDERPSRVCVLGAAPTHAARKNLEKSLGVISDDMPPPDRKPTLHRSRVLISWLWRWKPEWKNCQLAQLVLTARPSSLALFVDESSMVDLETWHLLFETLLGLLEEVPFLRVRCVLVGDHNQLPPVGPGAVFENLCTCGLTPVFKLTKVYRQEAISILRTAELYTAKCSTPYWTMKNGYVHPILEANDPSVYIRKVDLSGCTKGIPNSESYPQNARGELGQVEGISTRRSALASLLVALQEVEASFGFAGISRDSIQVVTFTNELCYILHSLWSRRSIEEIEVLLTGAQDILLKRPGKLSDYLKNRYPWKPGDTAIFKKNTSAYFKNNDPCEIVAPESVEERQRHNADPRVVCVLWTAVDNTRIPYESEEDDVVLHIAPGGNPGELRLIVSREHIAPGVARTIHSVQGMGFAAVIYVLSKPSENLRANSHYTGITRAKKKLCLMGDLTAFCNSHARVKDIRRTLLPILLRVIMGRPEEDNGQSLQLPAAELEKTVALACSIAADRRSIPKKVRLFLWERHIGREFHDGPCVTCGRRIEIDHMHVMHVISVANGGSNHVDNLRPCCSTCNLKVGISDLENFRSGRVFTSPPASAHS